MTNGPLPPHERSWRHPSELPPPPPEPTTRTGRVLIVALAAVGLVLVGVMALTITPDRVDQAGGAVVATSLVLLDSAVVTGNGERPASTSAVATSTASTTLVGAAPATSGPDPTGATAPAGVTSPRDGGDRTHDEPTTSVAPATPADTPRATDAPSGRVIEASSPTSSPTASAGTGDPGDTGDLVDPSDPVDSFATIDNAEDGDTVDVAGTVGVAGSVDTVVADTFDSVVDSVLAAVAPPPFPLVTPVGPDGLAITTHAACECPRGAMSATLPSGSVVGVVVVDADGPLVVVSLPADAGVAAMPVADSSHGAPVARTVMYAGVYTAIDPQSAAALCTPEAAPVLDDHGMLVGLCTDGEHGASIVAVDSIPPAPTTSTVPSSASTAVTTSTVAPSSTSTTVVSSSTAAAASATTAPAG